MKKLISIILVLMFVLCLLPLQAFAASITKVEVTGIDAPVVGQSPDMKAVAGDGYYNHANRIQWKEYNGSKIYQRDLAASDTFRAGYYYAVFVTVFTDADMPFTSETTGTINGKSAQIQQLQDDGCSIVLVYNFAEILKEPVTELDLTIPAPVDGEKPDYTKLDGEGYYSDNGLNGTSTRIYKNGIAWYKSATSAMTPGTGETFRSDTEYLLKISLLPKEGYFFQENISVTINGKPATVEFFDDGSINASVTLMAASPAHTHTPSDWRITGAYHYTACTTCGEFLEQEDHKGGVATCTEKGKCTVCGYAYLETNEDHNPDTTTWTACGGLYHAHLCKDCGAHCDPEDHEAGPVSDPCAAQVCRVCGYVMVPAKDPAANPLVTFTTDSVPEAGGTLTVDKSALMDNGKITAEMYNALLEGNVLYQWYKDGVIAKEGTGADARSYKVTQSDQGCTIYVKLSFYEDDSFHESKKCAVAVSAEITIRVAQPEPTEPTPPTTEPTEPTPPTTEPTEPTPPTTEPTEPTPPMSEPTQPPASQPTDPTQHPASKPGDDTEHPGNQNREDEFPWWGYLIFVLSGACAVVGVGLVILKLKKKA